MDAWTMQLGLVVALAVPVLVLLVLRFQGRRGRLPLPPGPPQHWLFGHTKVVPAYRPEVAYAEWSKEYSKRMRYSDSDILYLNMGGQPVIILNSVAAAVDLLEHRSLNYSDRPTFTQFELMGWEHTLTFLRWGPRFHMHRRLVASSFTKQKIVQYQELQTTEARRLAKGIMDEPEEWEQVLRRFSTSVILGIAFGVTVEGKDSPYVQMAKDTSYAQGHGGAPGATTVDFFPWLRYLPNWLARSKSLKFARDWRWAVRRIHDEPYKVVAQEFKEGRAQPSFVNDLLEQDAELKAKGEPNPMTEADVKAAAGTVFAAGQDTTWATIVVFILNMILNPDVRSAAQSALDRVVGPDRLPTFADRDDLPLIDYIVQETFRWAAASPLGAPHRSMRDDTYKGYFIPAGSFVFANAQGMSRDERDYKDPERFEPMRYAPVGEGGRGEPFPRGHFGFGRRVCPGQLLGEASVWMVVATLLHTLTIEKARGEDGEEVTPVVRLTGGLTSHPEHFDCVFKPRTQLAEQLVADVL